MHDNLILLTDSYKASHWRQYPARTQAVHSYFESRGGRFRETVFFGLQYFLDRYLSGQRVCLADIDEAEKLFSAHMGPGTFNREGWVHILRNHDGKLPVSIRAVPEGATVTTSTPLMTIENTDPACWWLTNYLETLLVQVWYPTTVATLSRECKKVILRFLDETGDPAGIGFKLHDFGFRGVSSVESAGIGGCAHLVNFQGTDTVAALVAAQRYYGADVAGYSIPAAEHSTITSWGRDREADAFRNMLTQWPKGLVAVVSDSYDIFNACQDLWGKELKAEVLRRDGTLVVRPDSGDPEETVLKVLQLLGEAFGYEVNAKGFKVLNPKVRVIQGNGVDYDSIQGILGNMRVKGWSADNLAFGMGGALLQRLDRDTQKFAFKCSAINVDGTWRDVSKSPVGASWKASKPGRHEIGWEVFRDGEVKNRSTFAEVRARAEVKA